MNRKREISLLGALAFCVVVVLINQLLKIDAGEEKQLQDLF